MTKTAIVTSQPAELARWRFTTTTNNLPVFKWGLTQGMATRDIVEALRDWNDDDVSIARVVPCSIQHNVAFIVDLWKLRDKWDIKCDDMGSWSNQGRKNFKKGTIDDHFNVYRQSYCHGSLTSLKKYLVYLSNNKGDTYRYMFVQYVFTECETTLHLPPHGNAKHSPSQSVYRRMMPSTVEAIRSVQAKLREIMHIVIDDRGGIDNIRSSGEYPRDRTQIYRARSNSSTRKDESRSPTDPFVQLLQISKEQQRGNREN